MKKVITWILLVILVLLLVLFIIHGFKSGDPAQQFVSAFVLAVFRTTGLITLIKLIF
jgi:hypothetical protein